jgi:hypothetical protein
MTPGREILQKDKFHRLTFGRDCKILPVQSHPALLEHVIGSNPPVRVLARFALKVQT